MEVSIKITHEMEIIPIIKYWIPHLKILQPSFIDEKILKDIEAYRSLYQK